MSRWTLSLGRPFGIPVRLHVGLIAVVVVLIALAPAPELRLRSALIAVIVLASLVAHELAHALTARRYGINTQHIVLHPLGGVAVLESRPQTPAAEFWIAAAAPLTNLAIAGLAFAALHFFDLLLLEDIAWPNLLLGAANLIPAFPLDGGRMLRALLSLRLTPLRATRWAARLGRFLAAVAFTLGFTGFEPVLAVLGLMIFFAAAAEERASLIHGFVDHRSIHQSMEAVAEALPAGGTVAEALRILKAAPRLAAVPVMFGERVVGVIYREAALLLAATSEDATLAQVLDRNVITQEGDGPLLALLQRMGEQESRAAVVLADGAVQGVITIDRLLEELRSVK